MIMYNSIIIYLSIIEYLCLITIILTFSMIFEGTGMRNIYLTVAKFPCLIECKNCRAVDCEQRREGKVEN